MGTPVKVGTPTKERVMYECKKELAMNFETPAARVLAFWGSFLGVTGTEMEKMLRKAVKQ